jgi:hypothetical protein
MTAPVQLLGDARERVLQVLRMPAAGILDAPDHLHVLDAGGREGAVPAERGLELKNSSSVVTSS